MVWADASSDNDRSISPRLTPTRPAGVIWKSWPLTRSGGIVIDGWRLVREVISTSSCVVAPKTEVAPHTWACAAVLAVTTTRPSGNSPKLYRPSEPVLVLCAAVQTGAVQLRERTRTHTGKSE